MSLLLDLTQVPASAVPDPEDVAVLLRERLYLDSGVQEITFTGKTRPDAASAAKLIEFAAADVASRVGMAIPEQHLPEARRLAALQAAALIESSFFPRELDSDQSAYRQYTAMFLSGIDTFVRRVRTLNDLGV